MYENSMPDRRYRKTLSFMMQHVPAPVKVLDLGVSNPFAQIMTEKGYTVSNTRGEDLDEDHGAVGAAGYDVVTAFEIFEHLLSPYTLLKSIRAEQLVISVPLNVWFAKPHQNPKDLLDRHYHEFYSWQLDWLLEKTGWEIVHAESWKSPDRIRLGIRPLLRFIWPSYYFVYCRKKI